MSKTIEIIATAPFGLEAVVAREIRNLGYSPITENGRVSFAGDELAICRANLWLRSADRVFVKVGEFKARTFDELFEKTKALPWKRWLAKGVSFPVRGKSVRSKLHHVPSCQSIVKKAIVNSLTSGTNTKWLAEKGPEHAVEVGLLKDVATITLDTSGAGLHRRGYRTSNVEAPLRENIAAALIMLSFWEHDRVLADPFCGSGTIPIEAALIGLNLAPGLKRTFAAEKWPAIESKHWNMARTEAQKAACLSRKLKIIGTDIDEKALAFARAHARKAGVDQQIHFQKNLLEEFRSSYKYGCAIMNPPYGERIGSDEYINKLYKEIGRVFSHHDTWSVYVLTPDEKFEKRFGKSADKNRKLYNGRIKCYYYQFFGPPPKRNSLV